MRSGVRPPRARQPRFDDYRARILETGECELRQPFDFGIKIGEPVIAYDAEAQAFDRRGFESAPIAGHHRIEQGKIRDAASVRPDLIEKRRDRHASAG